MNDIKSRILIITFCLVAGVANAQQKATWDYPVKPGMEKWQQFKSMEEMYQACQIPDNILKQVDTESLVDICLKFPALPLFPLFNTPQQAFMEYYSNFIGIKELFERKDAGQYLLEKYALMSLSEFDPLWPLHQQGQFVSQYRFVESILSQPQIIASLDANGHNALLKESIRKMDEKLIKNDLFGGYSLSINMWVIGNLLYSENRSLLQEHNQEAIQTALKSGFFDNIDVDMLYKQAKNYLYENK